MSNIDGPRYSKASIKQMIDSGDWPTPITESLREECAKVAQYDAQSLNQQDQLEQKRLYIKMLQEPTEYDETSFAVGLRDNSIAINGVLPLCLKYLDQGCRKVIVAEEGIWRLWYPPKDVPTAKALYDVDLMKRGGDNERVLRNLNTSLENRESPSPNPVDQTLDETMQQDKDKNKKKDNPKDEENKGPSGSNQASSSKCHKLSGEPVSPQSIERAAKSYWLSYANKMAWHKEGDYPKAYELIQGTEYFILEGLVDGLSFDQEEYSPVMGILESGTLKYEMVTPYNQKWLPKDHKGLSLIHI